MNKKTIIWRQKDVPINTVAEWVTEQKLGPDEFKLIPVPDNQYMIRVVYIEEELSV